DRDRHGTPPPVRCAAVAESRERPNVRTGPRVERADRGGVRDDQQILEAERRRIVLLPHVDRAAAAERRYGLARYGVERGEPPPGRDEQPRPPTGVAGQIRERARGRLGRL